eukprot:2388514-Rhodomonas_salina.2
MSSYLPTRFVRHVRYRPRGWCVSGHGGVHAYDCSTPQVASATQCPLLTQPIDLGFRYPMSGMHIDYRC